MLTAVTSPPEVDNPDEFNMGSTFVSKFWMLTAVTSPPEVDNPDEFNMGSTFVSKFWMLTAVTSPPVVDNPDEFNNGSTFESDLCSNWPDITESSFNFAFSIELNFFSVLMLFNSPCSELSKILSVIWSSGKTPIFNSFNNETWEVWGFWFLTSVEVSCWFDWLKVSFCVTLLTDIFWLTLLKTGSCINWPRGTCLLRLFKAFSCFSIVSFKYLISFKRLEFDAARLISSTGIFLHWLSNQGPTDSLPSDFADFQSEHANLIFPSNS